MAPYLGEIVQQCCPSLAMFQTPSQGRELQDLFQNITKMRMGLCRIQIEALSTPGKVTVVRGWEGELSLAPPAHANLGFRTGTVVNINGAAC